MQSTLPTPLSKATLPNNAASRRATLVLMQSILKQQTRRAITNYDLFSSYFARGGFDGRKSQKSTLVDLKAGLTKLGIDAFGTHDSPMHLFNCLDNAGRGYFTLKDFITAMAAFKEYKASPNGASAAAVYPSNPKITRSLREDQVRKSFERIARSPTESSLRWQSSQLYHRTFDSSCDDDKDHDPRKLLAGMSNALQRRSLRDWDIFMICDEDRNGSVTPMEFANGLHKLHFNYTPRQLKRLWETIDMDRSGRIDFDELRLALQMASDMGENTLPGQSNTSGGSKSGRGMEVVVPRTELKEEESNKHEDGKDGEDSNRVPKEVVVDERTRILQHRAFLTRRRVAKPRLKVLLFKLRAAISSWYNHDRKAFLTRHCGNGSPTALSPTPSPVGSIAQQMDQWSIEQTAASTPTAAAAPAPEECCRMTIGRAKLQLRTMVPFTTKEMHAYVSLLGMHASMDEEITVKQFDGLLGMIEKEMKISNGPRNLHSPEQRLQRDTFLIDGSIEDIIGSEPQNTPNTQTNTGEHKTTSKGKKTALVPTATPIAIHLDHLIHKMQHQSQRSELLNESLFSGVNFKSSSCKSLRLQFNLLGFNVTVNDIQALQQIFGQDDDSAVDLHYCLICRKLQNACYSKIDDTVLRTLAEHDVNGDGYIEINQFVRVLAQHVSLQLTEAAALYNILMLCAHKEERNQLNSKESIHKKNVCRYVDMFMKTPIMCHGNMLQEVVEVSG